MIITLNNEPFDITIENEKLLNELFSGLSEWLKESGYEITDLVMDDSKLELDKISEWGKFLLEDIKKLNINAILESDKYISDLQTIYQYITLLRNAIISSNNTLSKDLLSELPYITSVMDSYLTKKDLHAYGTDTLLKLIEVFKKEDGINTNTRNTLIKFLDNITVIFQTRVLEVSSPFSELHKTANKLDELLPAISEISVMLQTGDDKQAMGSVLNFIELSEKLIRIFPFLKENGYTDVSKISINSENFNDFYKDLNNILGELVDAFNIQDSILIGDLMEYEISPRISKLLD
nr:hypothetical protein [Spirochaetia bacterium]